MKRFILSMVALLAATSSVHAGAFSSIFQNQVVKLQDVDYEYAFDSGDDSLDAGDYLLAIIEIENIRLNATNAVVFPASAATTTITGVSLVKILGAPTLNGTKGVDAERADYVLGGVTGAEWSSLTGLTGISDGTALIAYEDPIGVHLDTSSLLGGVASAAEGTILFEFAVDNFFTARVRDEDGGTFDPTNIANIDGLTSRGDFKVNVSYVPGIELVEHDGAGFGFTSQLQLDGGLESGGGAGAFDIITDTDLYIYAVPEPTSFAIFAALMGGGAVARRRRK
ncbi:hypothetical protein CKO51_05250 [Rhodopirellula sp. SM50]|nr:PEP-CTERM sorting domain-containing protein [Rhodopirellula sp. SM50]PAY20625.1 hypothetical protein CKO51_05250 [Rhodopirellula sp. SM50]